jgi:DNA-binding NtrC family response regulator
MTGFPRAVPIAPRHVPASKPDVQQVIAALGTALARNAAERNLPAVFEYEVQRLLSVRAVRLREIPTRYQVRLVTPTRTAESVVLSVPTADPHNQAILEASVDPDRPLGDWEYEALVAAAQLAGLVLEASRARTVPPPARSDAPTPLVGASLAMQQLRRSVERLAQTDFTILIEGESGTGKELVARQLHELSRRRNGPFVALNCAAVVETLLEAELFGIEERTATGVRGRRGKFEHADGGTLFLDEVSDLSMAAQAKLLRAIQELAVERVGGHGVRRVNTRILAATNRPLSDMVARGLFRTDLYYRLGGVEISVPSLRERREDIPALARHFLERHQHTRMLALSPAAEEALGTYDWPGNVRELERVIERIVALAQTDQIQMEDLPDQVRGRFADVIWPSLQAGDSLRLWGSRYVRLVYERCGRNKRTTCAALDISYHTLRAYLRHARRHSTPSSQRLPAWVRSVSDPVSSE